MTEMTYMTTEILISEFIYLIAMLASLIQAVVVLYYIYNGSNGLSRNQFARHVLVSAYCGYELYLGNFYPFQVALVLIYFAVLAQALWLSSQYKVQPSIRRKAKLCDTQPIKNRSKTGTIEAILDRVDGTIVDKPE